MGTPFKVASCYGGHDIKTEKNTLSEAPSVLVGTPGRICHHIRNGSIKLERTTFLVLDEFDKSLEYGFQKEMEAIVAELTGIEKIILTSATKALIIPSFLQLASPLELNFLSEEQPRGLTQKAVVSEDNDKLDVLIKLIGIIGNKATMVFCNHRDAVERISELLTRQGVVHDIFHGKLEQQDRERALVKLRNGTNTLLITTDLASRGLDIPEIEFVVHYQLPVDASAFVHRNGRTARMHANGTSYLILKQGDTLPEFIKDPVTFVELPTETELPSKSDWQTLYFGAGKKDKINKIDIVGLLLQKGGLEKEELGKIEVSDYCAYAAVKRDKAKSVVSLLRNEKIKKKQVKIDLAR